MSKVKPSPRKAYYIEWLDSISPSSGWVTLEHAESMSIDPTFTIGWMVKETKDHITMCLTESLDTDQRSGVMCIPKCSIIKKKSIKL